MPSIDNLKAVNAAFGYSFPKEVAYPKNAPPNNTCKELSALNGMKVMMYVPVMRTPLCGNLISAVMRNAKKASATDKALCARAIIAEALGSFLGGIVLAIVDIFFTILVKPFINLAVFIHNKKEAKAAKLLEEQNGQNPPTESPSKNTKPIQNSQPNSKNPTPVKEVENEDMFIEEIIDLDNQEKSGPTTVVAQPLNSPKHIEIKENENVTTVTF